MIIRPANNDDSQELIENMRDSDRAEIAMCDGGTPDDIVPASIFVSKASFAMRADHEGPLFCLFGVSILDCPDGMASVWELGTPEIDRDPVSFWRTCRKALATCWHAVPKANILYNYIPASNDRSRRWLERLGAIFHPVVKTTAGIDMVGFTFIRQEAPHV